MGAIQIYSLMNLSAGVTLAFFTRRLNKSIAAKAGEGDGAVGVPMPRTWRFGSPGSRLS